jgi:invasion protein IalB
MRASRWSLISAAGVLLLSGAGSLLATQGLAGVETTASGVKPAPALIRQAQQREAPAPTTPPGTPHRVETTMYDSWAVTCEDMTVSGAPKRTCMASLRVVDQNRTVVNWQIGLNQEGHFMTAVHVPSGLAVKQGDKSVGGPIMVARGMELKFGNGPARRLSYVWCGPQQCMAEAPIDDAFVKEALANPKATLTVFTAGGTIPFELSIKGIDKAISSTRK